MSPSHRCCARKVLAVCGLCLTTLLSWAGDAPTGAAAAPSSADYAPVLAGAVLQFPKDFGSHPNFRTEWWYLTGWLTPADGRPVGFQVTFFRIKPTAENPNPSAFAVQQLLIAHCALSDPAMGHLLHDQRVRRAGMGLVLAEQGDTGLRIDDWTLTHKDHVYRATLAADGFALDLALAETAAVLLHGVAGFSRKGPENGAASYYYSVPHLAVRGTIARGQRRERVTGEAWLDHEWSSRYLDSQAAGWDWIGINLEDGGALMAFRIRGLDGATRWAGGSWRRPDGALKVFGVDEVQLTPARRWVSPHTGISYPIEWQMRIGAMSLNVRPLMDDQENDARLSSGAIYWEGAATAQQAGRLIGRGYLELTGYGERLRFGTALAPTDPHPAAPGLEP